ncbi:MFS transporter [Schumannella luteola]|uniref:CP family cyanate transporter-like MFS transporter n=1 Tax=Schumannella luteola TaxID=472059 RepID=A0A852YPR5_9MICO|nr:CP family cyanate transporter-like MFS transporter [Schumannella luteola]TPX06500.1 MFS transporter [Schumannella luteola]
MSAALSSSRVRLAVVIVGIVLLAFSLRTAVASVSPIVDAIDSDIGFPHPVVSIMGALPPLAFALGGVLTPLIVRRLGLETATVVSIIVMAAGHVLRAAAPDAVVLVAGSAIALLGTGFGNVLMPPIVKRWFPKRIGLLTAIYSTVIAASTAVSAALSVPVTDALGWRVSLAQWAITAGIALAPWIVVLAQRRASGQPAEPRDAAERDAEELEPAPRRVWRSPTAIAIALVFGTSSVTVYTAFSWMPAILTERAHVDNGTAAAMLAAFSGIVAPLSAALPLIASRLRNVAPLVFGDAALLLIGSLGLLLSPANGTWAWVLVYGLGPSLFPLALYLITARTRSHRGSVALSGFVQTFGYVVAALGPIVVGSLFDATGSWFAGSVAMVVMALPAIPAGIILLRSRYVEDELAR